MRPALTLCALFVLTAAARAGAAAAPHNLALGGPYTLSPAPNYHLCTDADDKLQLTDGKHAGPETFWGQPVAIIAATTCWAAIPSGRRKRSN